MFLDCPAYLDAERIVRCGIPAEVRCRFTMRSTDGPLESAMIRCPAGHWFNGSIEFLTWEAADTIHPGTAAAASGARHDSLYDTGGDSDGRGGSALRDLPAGPGQRLRRPNGIPAYYLGRPARLWIAIMSPRRIRR